MKKTFLLVVLMSLIGINYANAQSSLIATLSHENDVKVFYGASALKEAHEVAVGGDVITLSSGTFSSCNITKAVTLRGAGMAVDTVNNVMPTILSGNFNIEITDSLNRFTMEGIYNNQTIGYVGILENPTFLKCRLKTIVSVNGDSRIRNGFFLHCRISQSFPLIGNASLINCIVNEPSGKNSIFEFDNCIIRAKYRANIYSTTFKNCILLTSSGSEYIEPSCVAYNCVTDYAYHFFSYITNSTNKSEQNLANLFKTYTKESSFENLDSETFELTEEAKTKYLGTDGTQVGIYGGSMPFDITPTNPRITKCNVAAKSTVDGKLSVDIQVNAVE